MRFWLTRLAAPVALLTALFLADCRGGHDPVEGYVPPTEGWVVPPAANEPPPWPEWVLRPWVWEDESTQASATDLVDGYLENDIPVGAIILDSPWATGYSTFVFDPLRYPDPEGMIDHFHGLGVRVLLWTVPAINLDSPNYVEAFNNGYFLNQGRTVEWWKGRGSFIDYTNPEALDWWHGQMDQALDLGIDGWKCDMAEVYLRRWLVLEGYAGPIAFKDYQETYYRDFFRYTRERLGEDRVITARPVDSFGFPEWGDTFAPRDANFAGWVGDQDADFQGLRNALYNLFLSAQAGYVNFGSDIGGYNDDGLRDRELLLRWAQLGAFSPIMENGGRGEHRPWMYDAETVRIYRAFAGLHTSLVPYLYSEGARAYLAGTSLLRPLAQGEFHYLLGDSLLVAPITQPEDGWTVTFPEGNDWIDLFTGEVYEGGTVRWLPAPLDYYPVFIRRGAILPLDLADEPVFATRADQPRPLVVSFYPRAGDAATFALYEENGPGANLAAQYGRPTLLSLSATERAYTFRLVDVDAPAAVEVVPTGVLARTGDPAEFDGWDAGYLYDETDRELWIKPGDPSRGLVVTIR